MVVYKHPLQIMKQESKKGREKGTDAYNSVPKEDTEQPPVFARWLFLAATWHCPFAATLSVHSFTRPPRFPPAVRPLNHAHQTIGRVEQADFAQRRRNSALFIGRRNACERRAQ